MTVPLLPNNYTIVTAFGSQWSGVFTVTDDDGTLADLTTKTFELVIRNRLGGSGTTLASVSSTASTVNGTLVVSVVNSTVEAILTPTAVSTVTTGGAPYALWMNPGLSDATALVTGVVYVNPIAAP